MKKFDDYEFQIEWIENIESITEDDKKRLYELRTLNKRRKTHLNYLKKNQKIYDECKRREKLIREIEKEEKEVFDDVSLLKKVIIPKILFLSSYFDSHCSWDVVILSGEVYIQILTFNFL